MVLLSITPLPDGVLQLDIIAPFHTSGPPLLQFHLDIEQWGFEETETKTIAFPISFESIKYVFLSKIYGPASGGADTVAYNFFRKSLTGVSFDYAYTRNWLAIGGQ